MRESEPLLQNHRGRGMSWPSSLHPCRLLIAGIVITTLAVPFGVQGQSGDPEADLEIALAALEKQAELTQSWTIEFIKTVTYRDHPNDPFKRQTMRHTERKLGNKFRITDDELDAAKPEHRWNEHRTFDGQRQMTLDPVHNSGSINSSDFRPSQFGRMMYGDLQPLPGVLKEWERLCGPEWVMRDGRRLLSLKLYNPKTFHEYDVFLDPVHNWQPAEVTSLCFNQRGGTKETSDWLESQVVYRSYHQDGEICLPTKQASTADHVQRNGGRYRSVEGAVEVTSIQINSDLSDETFAIEFPTGTKVFDKERRVTYITGQRGSEKRVPKPTVSTDGTVPLNTSVGPWWSDARLWVTLCAVFIAGAIWWGWREKRN